jgi:hypothetical protein
MVTTAHLQGKTRERLCQDTIYEAVHPTVRRVH